ncbi:DUF1016 N-terminal domain-containing protein [Georgenia soli]|uniref:DUF1016 N-terminal domain-containing protein n=1 Tax=Georgenia soli TaxID=638953 RepID=UPI000BF8F2BE|nr:DUF1016 N-terminal domain-containing protein [Georgenia soli]
MGARRSSNAWRTTCCRPQRNLQYMRAVAAASPDPAFVHQLAAQLPKRHVTVLLDRLDEPSRPDWYAAQAVEHGWSRNVLSRDRTAASRRQR